MYFVWQSTTATATAVTFVSNIRNLLLHDSVSTEWIRCGGIAGKEQWWAASTKTVTGTLLSAAICFPSLYIFAVLSGADIRAQHVVGLCLTVTASTGVFLAGYGPVAWIFTQSSNSVAVIAPIHLVL